MVCSGDKVAAGTNRSPLQWMPFPASSGLPATESDGDPLSTTIVGITRSIAMAMSYKDINNPIRNDITESIITCCIRMLIDSNKFQTNFWEYNHVVF